MIDQQTWEERFSFHSSVPRSHCCAHLADVEPLRLENHPSEVPQIFTSSRCGLGCLIASCRRAPAATRK